MIQKGKMTRSSKRKANAGVGISRALKKRVEPTYLASTNKLGAAKTKAMLYLQAGGELQIEGVSFGKDCCSISIGVWHLHGICCVTLA